MVGTGVDYLLRIRHWFLCNNVHRTNSLWCVVYLTSMGIMFLRLVVLSAVCGKHLDKSYQRMESRINKITVTIR